MSTRLIFLVGAPSGRLKWDDHDLLDEPIPPFTEDDACQVHDPSPLPSNRQLKWRLLQNREPLQLTSEIAPLNPNEEVDFFRIQDLAVVFPEAPSPLGGTGEQVLSQFYDHSFSIHERSQPYLSESSNVDSMQETNLSIDDTRPSMDTQPSEVLTDFNAPFPPLLGDLSNLEDIPSAEYLHSIVPQTMTVNLIVGILTVQPPRRVKTRQWNRELDIVELTVGDETKSGFGVTFWLPPLRSVSGAGSKHGDDVLRKTLADLCPRDIVLLRTVGLSSFRNRVYGQSLGKSMTKVNLLYRLPIHPDDSTGIYSSRMINTANHDHIALMKVRRVREWVRGCLWNGMKEDGGDGMPKPLLGTLLPPDTQ